MGEPSEPKVTPIKCNTCGWLKSFITKASSMNKRMSSEDIIPARQNTIIVTVLFLRKLTGVSGASGKQSNRQQHPSQQTLLLESLGGNFLIGISSTTVKGGFVDNSEMSFSNHFAQCNVFA